MKFKYIDPFNQDPGVQELSEQEVYNMVEKFVKYELQIPDNWDKHDYETQRYSVNDIISFTYNLLERMYKTNFELGFMYAQNSELNWGRKWSQ